MAKGDQSQQGSSASSEERPSDDRLTVKWIESQPLSSHAQQSRDRLTDLLSKAAQPRHASGNACIKLCYYLEQCRASQSFLLRELAFSASTCLDLFNFYLEWNEKNQNRSMRQVLELLASTISLNPDQEISASVKASILRRLVSIITHQSAQPLVKPAFKSLECFLSKSTLLPNEVFQVYKGMMSSACLGTDSKKQEIDLQDSFISEVFDWMILPDISPAAGKCLVTLFAQLRLSSAGLQDMRGDHTMLWQRWIRNGLSKNPDALENVKNYLFPPLFKIDRYGSLKFLEELNHQAPLMELKSQGMNAHFLLQLTALEAGKKAGLVEEPSIIPFQKAAKKATKNVVLQEGLIGSLLTYASDSVRSLAFSVLISSSSSIRPFTPVALDSLQSHMHILYTDTDAKFRNDVLSNTKQMIERIRGATAYLVRELNIISSVRNRDSSSRSEEDRNVYDETRKLLHQHESFIEWYLGFLLGELIPTASYQRHITSLKAIALLLQSGILKSGFTLPSTVVSGNATTWSYSVNFFTQLSLRLLLDLLMDPFEDVRGNAAAILKLASPVEFSFERRTENCEDSIPKLSPNQKLVTKDIERSRQGHDMRLPTISDDLITKRNNKEDNQPLALLTGFIARAEKLSKRTGRADYADGVARCYDLLYHFCRSKKSRLKLVTQLVEDLEAKVTIAEHDLARAVLDAPIHGSFAALNMVWASIDFAKDFKPSPSPDDDDFGGLEQIQTRIVSSCSQIWVQVKDVLCNDSPEGHLPQDLDEIDVVDTKDVLSYSFRAVHESSNLMGTMASKIKSTWLDESAVISMKTFRDIGDLAFEQLSSLRHRGAFSTVSMTFARCCQLSQNKTSTELSRSALLELWYHGAKSCIFEQASTTRRSAGIPALMTGILSANSTNPAFERVMMELKTLAKRPIILSAKDETNLPQVHAMNCLKEIFKSSTLGKRSEGHIAECLQLAADSLNSEIWAIRNCGLLLVRSLIDCLFGTNESKAVTEAGWDGRSIRLSYDRYPTLPELLLGLLKSNTSGSEYLSATAIGSVESVFPALDIIRRAGPPNLHRDEFFRYVSLHLGSKIWHVRELAARTICTLMLHQNWLSAVLKLMGDFRASTNRLHGILIAVKLILERRLELDPPSATEGLLAIASLLKTQKINNFFPNGQPEILVACLEISNVVAMILLANYRSKPMDTWPPSIRDVKKILFEDHADKEFDSLMKEYLEMAQSSGTRDAALGKAIIRRAIYTAAITEDANALLKIFENAAALNKDIVLAAIDCVSGAWQNMLVQEADFPVLRAFIGLLENSRSPEIRSKACLILVEALGKLFDTIKDLQTRNGAYEYTSAQSTIQQWIMNLGTILQRGPQSPSLHNAQVRISGWIMLCNFENQKSCSKLLTPQFRKGLAAWGDLLSLAGTSTNDFDTRYSAAAALQFFYNCPYFMWNALDSEPLFSSIWALYDSLNDDDDEIRDFSALTVSRLLKKSLVPLAARLELVEYVYSYLGRTSSFSREVVRRMTGSYAYCSQKYLAPVKLQLARVLYEDDSLFVEEEQNLFIDEVREAKLWTKFFEGVELDGTTWRWAEIQRVWAEPHTELAFWVKDGLGTLIKILDEEDEALGGISKPAVFAIFMRVLLCANAIIRRHEGLYAIEKSSLAAGELMADIVAALEKFCILGREKGLHSSLLYEVKWKPSLPSRRSGQTPAL